MEIRRVEKQITLEIRLIFHKGHYPSVKRMTTQEKLLQDGSKTFSRV